MRMFRIDGMERLLQSPLADDLVRYSGEPVAVVLADSRYAAEDALELIAVAYEPLDALLDATAALDPESPVLHPEAGTNLAGEIHVSFGDVDAAFAEADLVVEERLYSQRHGAVPMEPRGLVAEGSDGGGVTVWGAAKVVHTNRRILAALLGLPEDRVRLVELDVGGGFGGRGEFYPEDFLIPFCALRAGQAGELDRGPRGEPPRAQPLARADPRHRARPARRRHLARPARPLLLQHRRLRAHPRRRGPEHERGPAARPLPLGRLRLRPPARSSPTRRRRARTARPAATRPTSSASA